MARRVTRLSPETRRTLQVAGPIVCVVALVLIGWFFVSFFQGGNEFQTCVQDKFGETSTSACDLPTPPFAAMLGGMPLLFAGLVMTQFGYLKPVSEITATETEGAVEVTAGAVARGFREGLGRPLAATPVVRIRCRSCGFLETEDAKFCSRCASAL